ncbi:TRAP transporter permease [Billgrantia bachuensis]|uniref:TRAP transporter fused permease subunit n=1 Tax=Billgrantia bachuensis TaxID=2717286 RepID=A0ABX0PUR0_9GAMM|nr:TRAP transporter fused permease subunit [Halomonas bachuensis]NIC07174.1 TRAP transporter fused permease subunit [Halomonas bachuensis]
MNFALFPLSEVRLREVLAYTVGLGIALLGIVNSMPSFGPIPRLGPFGYEYMHPLMLGLACLTVVIRQTLLRKPLNAGSSWRLAGGLVDVIVLAVLIYALHDYYVTMERLKGGLFFFDAAHAWTALAGVVALLLICLRQWGLALTAVAGVALLYFYTGHHWPGLFRMAPIDFIDGTADTLWYNSTNGVLGSLLAIVINTILPFILLGALLEGSGAGGSMIKVSLHAFRRARGGPAHAAILSSGLFGSVSGSAVANVVGTGVITIPMIRRRGFSPTFAGGIEATASSGGQIMPPIMGAAALVMADFTGISYLTIIVAALIPALFYYGSLFAAVVYEARRLGIESQPVDMDPADRPVRQDYINLTMVFVPLTVVVVALIAGLSPAGAGILALFSVVPLSLTLNPATRCAPLTLVHALSRGGNSFATLLIAVGIVGIIVGVLSSTGLPIKFAQVIGASTGGSLLVSLLMAMMAALVLGMGMPTLPAYLTIILIMGPAMLRLGLEPLVAHMFVFYFGVASAITPPVAVAAFAAASISQASPLKTALEATRIGLVIFLLPFTFAFYPELLLVPEAGGSGAWYDMASILLRLSLAVLLITSGLACHDRCRLSLVEAALRVVAAIAMLVIFPLMHWPAFLLGVALLVVHRQTSLKKGALT